MGCQHYFRALLLIALAGVKNAVTKAIDDTSNQMTDPIDIYTLVGNKCVFPFVFEGVEYTTCAPGTIQPLPWCATDINNDKLVKGWGICDHPRKYPAQHSFLASSLRQCRVDNNIELNSCLLQTMDSLRPHLRTGVPELNLPVLEPMFIPNLNFRQGNGAVNINAVFRNLEIRGLSSFNTTYIDANPQSQTLNVGLYIPELDVTGNYDLSGQLIILPIEGRGPFWTNFNGINANGIGNIVIAGHGPTERLMVSNVFVDFDINRMRVKLDNLFNGDPILGETVHLFLNENGKEVLAEIKPEIQRRLNELVEKVMNDAFSQLPVDTFLLRN